MFCKNCGADVGNAKFCPNCGTNINETTTDSSNVTYVIQPAKKTVPLKRSLSFILFIVLGGALIGMSFIPLYVECRSKGLFDVTYYYDSLWHLASYSTSDIWAFLAIILFSIPIVLSVINFFARQKAIAIINTVATSASFLYLFITSIVLSENHYNSFKGYLGVTNVHSFSSFGIMFYIMLAISLILCAVSVFDTLNKPLIKLSK